MPRKPKRPPEVLAPVAPDVLNYAPGAAQPAATTHHRNGTTDKTVLTDDGPVALEIPRDRHGTFAPLLIPTHERRFTGVDDTIIAV